MHKILTYLYNLLSLKINTFIIDINEHKTISFTLIYGIEFLKLYVD